MLSSALEKSISVHRMHLLLSSIVDRVCEIYIITVVILPVYEVSRRYVRKYVILNHSQLTILDGMGVTKMGCRSTGYSTLDVLGTGVTTTTFQGAGTNLELETLTVSHY